MEDKNPNNIKTKKKGGFGLVDYLFVESIVKRLDGEKNSVKRAKISFKRIVFWLCVDFQSNFMERPAYRAENLGWKLAYL